MRARDFLYETIELISEKTSADDLIAYIEPLGFDVQKKTGKTVKVVVPAATRMASVKQIADTLPDSLITPDGKQIKFDDATILVKPAEAQGGRLEKEAGQLIAIDTAIKEKLKDQPFINLVVGNRTVQAAGAVNVSGNPKADIAIVDDQNNPVAWVSLKDGTSPKSFGQWGGVDHLGKDPEVATFINNLNAHFGNEFPRGPTYGVEINNPRLKALTCFGKAFGGEPGVSNVDLILQGHPVVKKGSKGEFVLDGSHVWANGEIPSGEYEPVLMVRFSSDRSNFRINNARITAYPKGGRPWKQLPDVDKVDPTPAPQPSAGVQNQQKSLKTSKIPMGSEPEPTSET